MGKILCSLWGFLISCIMFMSRRARERKFPLPVNARGGEVAYQLTAFTALNQNRQESKLAMK